MEQYILQAKSDHLGMLIKVHLEKLKVRFIISEIVGEGDDEIFVEKVCSGKITWDGSFWADYVDKGRVCLHYVNSVIAMGQAFEFLWGKAADHFSNVEDFERWEAGEPDVRPYEGKIIAEND